MATTELASPPSASARPTVLSGLCLLMGLELIACFALVRAGRFPNYGPVFVMAAGLMAPPAGVAFAGLLYLAERQNVWTDKLVQTALALCGAGILASLYLLFVLNTA